MSRLQNVGTTERMIRILVGLLIIAVSFLLSPPLSVILFAAGMISVITGTTGFCALYWVFGIGQRQV